MTFIGLTLLTLGCVDLVRRGAHRTPQAWAAPAWAAWAVALLVPPAQGALLGLHTTRQWLTVTLAVVTVLVWLVTSRDAMAHRRRHGLPVIAVVIGLALMALLGDPDAAAGPLDRWLTSSAIAGLADLGADGLVLYAGAVLVQLSTGNVVVRLVLASVDDLRPADLAQAADTLRGGRLLGPMERVFILGLGLAGEVTAAGLVIAAKGLLRFPELQAQARSARSGGPGIDEVTEYFLIGSFVSWLVSLSTLALLRLGG